MSFATLETSCASGIARVVFQRPEKRNSFTAAMHADLRAALNEVEEAGARVLVLSGAGRAFCAGQDLGEVPPGTDLGAVVARDWAPLVRRLRALPLPVVAAVQGVAAGAGANVALACDLVVAARSATFVEPFCQLGLVPDTGGTFFLPRLCGTARALGLALLGEKLTGEHAAAWGLIWRCVADEDLDIEVQKLAEWLAAAPTLGLARTKQALYAAAGNTLEQQLELEGTLMRELGQSADYAEGVAAFREKRPPRFQGR